MYQIIQHAEYRLPSSDEQVSQCSSGLPRVSALYIQPNQYGSKRSFARDDDTPELPPCTEGRYHVPLSIPNLLADEKFSLFVEIEGEASACDLIITANTKKKDGPITSYRWKACQQHDIPLRELINDLKLDGVGPYKLSASVVSCSTKSAERWIYLDDDAPTFGFELEFVRDEYFLNMSQEPNQQIRTDLYAWRKALEKLQEHRPDRLDERYFHVAAYYDNHGEGFTVTYPHLLGGWSYRVHYDPWTIEVNADDAKPLTLTDYEKIRSILQEDIFDFAAKGFPAYEQVSSSEGAADGNSELGDFFAQQGEQAQVQFKEIQDCVIQLKPRVDSHPVGAGHIHIGVRPTFCGKPLLLRNLFVRLLSAPTLACGVLNLDLENAAPVALLKRQKEVQDILDGIPMRDHDINVEAVVPVEPSVSDSTEHPTSPILRFAEEVHRSLYNEIFMQTREGTDASREKYVAYSLKTIKGANSGSWTLELRAIRSQRSIADFMTLIEALHSLIADLRRIKEPIQYEPLSEDLFGQLHERLSAKWGVPEGYVGLAPNWDAGFDQRGIIEDAKKLLYDMGKEFGDKELTACFGAEGAARLKEAGIAKIGEELVDHLKKILSRPPDDNEPQFVPPHSDPGGR